MKRNILTFLILTVCVAIILAVVLTQCNSRNRNVQNNINNNPLMANSDSGLLRAIERRGSALRDNFSGLPISENHLHLLGWAATGRNRGGTGFTVPLAMGREPYISLYLADASGVRRFSWQSNNFENVLDIDIRDQITAMYSDLKATAIWIYIIEKDKVPRDNMDWAWHAVGAMSQHQYLVAEEFNIQARYMATFGRDETVALLKLDAENQIPAGILVMAQKPENQNNLSVTPEESGVLRVIERRNSTARGSFTGKDISEDALHLLGWSATGRNRGGTGFTVPLGLGADPYVSVYLADASGVRKFSWQINGFENILYEDIREHITLMNTGAGASAIWIFVIELDKVPMRRMDIAMHAVGAMSQHQYLVAEEFDIQTRYMAAVNAEEVITRLNLDAENQIPIGVMIMAQK